MSKRKKVTKSQELTLKSEKQTGSLNMQPYKPEPFSYKYVFNINIYDITKKNGSNADIKQVNSTEKLFRFSVYRLANAIHYKFRLVRCWYLTLRTRVMGIDTARLQQALPSIDRR